MTPTPVDIDDLFLEQVEQARAQSFEQKFLAGGELFDTCCELMSAGIRMQYPDAGPERVQAILAERLALGRCVETRP